MPESQAGSRRLPAFFALGALSLAGSHYVIARAAQDAAAAPSATTEHRAVAAQSTAPVASPVTPAAGTVLNTLNTYCVTCHNGRLKTAGLQLDAVDVTRVADHAQQWEKVAVKLRTGEMPPPGRPRPDAATSRAVAAALERELDAAAAAHPHPGRVPVHRLKSQ
jgi:cytochrome c551/c552